ncbi:MAG: diguanylate cyclase [Rhizobiaceae bacterium]
MTAEFINQLLTPLIFAVFSCGFFAIWLQYRNLKSAGFFAISYLCGTIAFLFEIILPKDTGQSVLILRAIGDEFYLLIAMFFAIAISYRYSRPVPKVFVTFLVICASVANIWFWFGDENLVIRSHIISIACALMLLTAVPTIRSQKNRLIDRILSWLVIISAIQLIINPLIILNLSGEVLTINNFWSSTFLAVLNFSVALISMSLAVVLFVAFGMGIIAEYRIKSDMDVLSNLYNRRGFEEAAVLQVNKASDSGLPVALIVADLDQFKQINDRFGHGIGDRVIRNFATILKTACRPIDIIGRIGGEEFCILLPAATQEMGALVADGIRTSIAGFIHKGDESSLQLTASFGVAELRPGETYLSLFRRADGALYRAKEQGRDRVCRADVDELERISEFRKKLA